MDEHSDFGVRVFVSHDETQAPIARVLTRELAGQTIGWRVSDGDLSSGTSADDALAILLGDCDALVLLMSGAADSSGQVERELALAGEMALPVLIVRLEDVEPVRLRHWLDGAARVDWLDPQDAVPPEVVAQIKRLTDFEFWSGLSSGSAEDIAMTHALRRRAIVAGTATVAIVLAAIASAIFAGK